MGFSLILPAAGSGSRLGGQAKQFRLLGGKPVLVQVIRAFCGRADLDGVVVAASSDSIEQTSEMLYAENFGVGVEVVAGGETRQESVFRALQHASIANTDIVLIHDAVRPFITSDLISAVLGAATTDGAACPAVPVSDTLRRVSGSVFGETVDRENVFLVQTPQAFSARAILAAHEKAAADSVRVTDDVELYQAYAGDVTYVPGSVQNLKITRAEDWETALLRWPDFLGHN